MALDYRLAHDGPDVGSGDEDDDEPMGRAERAAIIVMTAGIVVLAGLALHTNMPREAQPQAAPPVQRPVAAPMAVPAAPVLSPAAAVAAPQAPLAQPAPAAKPAPAAPRSNATRTARAPAPKRGVAMGSSTVARLDDLCGTGSFIGRALCVNRHCAEARYRNDAQCVAQREREQERVERAP
jgi:hypothetical protein